MLFLTQESAIMENQVFYNKQDNCSARSLTSTFMNVPNGKKVNIARFLL